jgi:hypothetical protein
MNGPALPEVGMGEAGAGHRLGTAPGGRRVEASLVQAAGRPFASDLAGVPQRKGVRLAGCQGRAVALWGVL